METLTAHPSIGEVYEQLRHSKLVKHQTDFGAKMGWGKTYVSQLVKGERGAPKNWEDNFKKAFPAVDLAELLRKEGNRNSTQRVPGEIVNRYNVRFVPLPDGTWRMFDKEVPFAAHASFPGGWGDPVYMDTLPEHSMIVDRPSEDNFLTFPIVGECQDDGSRYSLYPGQKITGQAVSRDKWQHKFPFKPVGVEKHDLVVKKGNANLLVPEKNKRYEYWIFLNRFKGIQIARIKNQDVEKGIFYCSCRNPDKKKYPDFEIKLDDCAQILFGIEVGFRL